VSSPYVGEIRMFAGNFAPAGWALCDGAPLPISENDVLFQVIGTTYGGDGEETFNLPNLQSRVPVHMGQGPGLSQNYIIGEAAGVEQVTLTTQQIPNHTHALLVSSDVASQTNPNNNMVAQSTQATIYLTDDPNASMAPQVVSPIGGSQPHENMQPFLCINYIISLFGLYPNQ
jgi:microcystin-dependent protein